MGNHINLVEDVYTEQLQTMDNRTEMPSTSDGDVVESESFENIQSEHSDQGHPKDSLNAYDADNLMHEEDSDDSLKDPDFEPEVAQVEEYEDMEEEEEKEHYLKLGRRRFGKLNAHWVKNIPIHVVVFNLKKYRKKAVLVTFEVQYKAK
ncbi:hypothetical protein NQ317_013075 [Molorchus minor]|uniref:Uncharacterized protein n=1 Tax=Molorchus minor TaxID=1323400 RepID=A0ABQ9IT22_9CUCU|nr:hypothetical protein NQ317_013075 [Molorchus minor]